MRSSAKALYALAVMTLAWLSTSPVAAAQAGILLLPVTEPSISDADRTTAHRAILTYFTLHPPISLTRQTEEDFAAGQRCAAPTCAQQQALDRDVDFAVATRLFAPVHRGGPAGVAIALVARDGTAYTGNIEVDDGGFALAAARAIRLAHSRFMRGPGPWLTVTSIDHGSVHVDDNGPQTLPHLELLEPGQHRLIADDEDGKQLNQSFVMLPDDSAYQARIITTKDDVNDSTPVRLHDDRRNGKTSRYWSRKRSKWNYIIGVPITLAGMIYTSVGIAHYMARGECADAACMTIRSVNTTSKLALGLGVSALAVGAGGFLSLGILRERESPTRTAFTLQYRDSF